MAVLFGESGGNYHANNVGGPGVWFVSTNNNIINTAPAGRSTSFAYQSNQQELRCISFGNQTGLIAGYAAYIPTPTGQVLIAYKLLGVNQCDIRLDGSGHIIITRNGTTIGGPSTQVIAPNTWHYYEFKALFATGATGTVEVKLDGATILTVTSVQTATTTAAADTVSYFPGAGSGYATDFYCLDTVNGVRTTYLGDVNIGEIFDTAAGTNSAWTAANGPFTLTSVNTTGVYQGTITGGAANAYVGYKFDVTGFVNGANNQTGAICTASTATSITLGGITITETHAGSAAFQNPVQIGIATTGTRPSSDIQYVSDSTPNDLSDWIHQALVLTGTIPAVLHRSYARKDDAGPRSFALVTIQSAAVTETSATFSLSSAYQYYTDVLEQNPTGPADWTTTSFNAATFGVKEVA